MGYLNSRIEKYSQALKRWWLTLLLGLVVFAVGILIFVYPQQSYLAFSLFFGLMIIFSGIILLYAGVNAPKGSGRGWLIAGGVVETLLGILISFNLVIAASVLPLMLGLWLMFKGITVAVMASDMKHEGIEGRGWVIFLSVLMILSSLLIVIFPLIGVGAIIIWLGISFLIAGVAMIVLAFRLRKLKNLLDL